MPEQEKPLFGRYEKVVLLLMGFVLTSVVGGVLANYLQTRAALKKQQEETFTSVADLLDGANYELRRLFLAATTPTDSAELAGRKVAYRTRLDDWELHRNANFARVNRSYGAGAERCLGLIEQELLTAQGRVIALLGGTHAPAEAEAVSGELNVLAGDSYDFERALLAAQGGWWIGRYDLARCTPLNRARQEERAGGARGGG